MKFIFTKVICLFLLLFVFNTVFAQAPQKMSYQAVIRNTSGNLIVDTPVGIKIAILQGSTSGTEVFSETHNPTTSSNGLASIEIGAGTPITGTFATINWGLGPFFIKTETDPTGGTNYTISGTSQLLSVPYALYAEKTKFQGRNSIYIQDDISNAEAQAILQEQFGPNTENIYVRNTKGLTNLDLSMVINLTNLEITYNKDLTAINVDNLAKCYNSVLIEGNMLNQINFPLLQEANNVSITNNVLQTFQFSQFVKGNLTIKNNSLTSFDLPQYTSGNVQITDNPSLLQVYLPLFNSPSIFIYNCYALEIVNLPSVTTLQRLRLNYFDEYALYGGYPQIYFTVDLPNLKQVLLPSLVTVNEDIMIAGLNVDTISMPLLVSAVNLNIGKTKITSLNIASFLSTNLIKVRRNDFLQNINLGGLVSASAIDCSINPLLTSINLSSLSSLAGSATNYSYFAYNALPSSQINAILRQLLSVSPSVPKIVGLDHQTPLAPPTGVGITDKATLISQGNNIVTD